ncbi:MAG: hypothetical protein RLZZ437_1871 [Pseudomonadota bacterium]|jgi:ABC-type uncharacterized transport system substrate-binding protein
MRRWLMAAGCLVAPVVAEAHPHVFIDATVEVVFDAEGRAEALRIGWTYDEFFSMLIVEDRALDPDYDAVLTPEAEAELAGFDMQWDAGFAGDTYALMNGVDLPLSRPEAFSASYADGKITSTHLRRFETPVAVGDVPLIVQVYDPGFYTAYAIVGETQLTGRDDCSAQVFEPDRSAADEALLAALAEVSADVDIEIAYPAIGAAYAEEARITCANPS